MSSAVAAVYGIVFFVAHGASFASRARGPVGHYMTFAGQLLLLISTAAGILSREWAEAHGCAGFLRKPVETDELLDEVRRCLG